MGKKVLLHYDFEYTEMYAQSFKDREQSFAAPVRQANYHDLLVDTMLFTSVLAFDSVIMRQAEELTLGPQVRTIRPKINKSGGLRPRKRLKRSRNPRAPRLSLPAQSSVPSPVRLEIPGARSQVPSRLALPRKIEQRYSAEAECENPEADRPDTNADLVEFALMSRNMVPNKHILDQDRKAAISLLLGMCGGIVLAHRQYEAMIRPKRVDL